MYYYYQHVFILPFILLTYVHCKLDLGIIEKLKKM